jgi:hypothetical protein
MSQEVGQREAGGPSAGLPAHNHHMVFGLKTEEILPQNNWLLAKVKKGISWELHFLCPRPRITATLLGTKAFVQVPNSMGGVRGRG